MKYAIKSNITGRYLSNLFEDSHEKTFQAKEATPEKAYFWDSKEIAEGIAKLENGTVISKEN